ncbi:MAG: hypothetical protein M3005_03960 [Apilactobacillus sp.]|uniref:hypothetical protein n=1 Tax=Apilactobacillus TaxID=2767877 RepID=UPI0025FD85A9|nr:hypothetical protein [Apilactobacillus sp.]MCT6823013.1 hypothetical protein [Apilactobacillus sp.]MCT6858444.1 hypothetical protein [Apilactobacillus sp.]
MGIKKANDKAEFKKVIDENGYNEVATFLVYPHGNDESRKPKKRALLSKNDINSSEFFESINTDNGFMFVGLNYAERDSADTDDEVDTTIYQTYHDIGPKSHDMSIYSSIHDTKAYGSFAMDILNKFVKTEISESWINTISKELLALPKMKAEKIFNMNDIEPFDPYEFKKKFSARSESAKVVAKNFEELEKLEQLEKEYKKANKDTSEIKEKKAPYKKVINEYNKAVTVKELTNRFINVDAPAFAAIVNLLDPKCLICFGKKTYILADAVVKAFDLNVDVEQITHYSFTGKTGVSDITKYKRDEVLRVIEKY